MEYVSSVIINIRQLSLAVTPSLFLSGSYSNLSLLYVTGLIRLDPSIEATSTAVTMPRKKFEKVWPTKEQRKAALVAAKKHFKDMGISEYVPSYFYTDDYFHFHGFHNRSL